MTDYEVLCLHGERLATALSALALHVERQPLDKNIVTDLVSAIRELQGQVASTGKALALRLEDQEFRERTLRAEVERHKERIRELESALSNAVHADWHNAEVERLHGLLREWHDKDWKRTASECLPKNHLVLRTRAALTGEKL